MGTTNGCFSRRTFLAGGVSLGALAAVGAEVQPPDSKIEGLPDWAAAEIESAAKRYEAWKGTDETVAVVVITDCHSNALYTSDPVGYKDAKMHMPFALACADRIGADATVNLGDLYLESPNAKIGAQCLETVRRLHEGRYAPRPLLFCVGNHDTLGPAGASEPHGHERNCRFGEALNRPNAAVGHDIRLSACGSWGFCDFKAKKFRLFFLNSSDTFYFGFSDEQLQFLCDGLASLGKGWQTAVVLHHCVVAPIGSWTSWKGDACRNRYEMMKILGDFVFRRKGSAAEGKITWDFTKLDETSFAGYFCGDSHFDNQIDLDFVHYTIFQGYGFCPEKERIYGSVYTPFDKEKMINFDIVAMKPTKREVRLFRVGAGGVARDRGYSYATYPQDRMDRIRRWR